MEPSQLRELFKELFPYVVAGLVVLTLAAYGLWRLLGV